MHDDPRYHYISVQDNGPGIDAKQFQNIFKVFNTLEARDTFESTGIGLSIVKRIVEKNKGTVSVESNVGEGAKFTFSIPKVN